MTFGAYSAIGAAPYATRSLAFQPNDIDVALEAGRLDPVYTLTFEANVQSNLTIKGKRLTLNGSTLVLDNVVKTLRYSNVGYTTKPTHTPANQHYDAILTQPLRYRRSLRNRSRLGGRGAFRSGEAELQDLTRSLLNSVRSGGVDGRPAEIRWGRNAWDHKIFPRLYANEASGWQMRGTTVRISLRGSTFRLDKPLNGENRYQGTGDREGGQDVQGQRKPAAFGGEHKNVAPPLLNLRASNQTTGLLVYDLHNTPDGAAPIKAVNAVFDRAVELTRADSGPNGDGDFTTFEDLRDATTGQFSSGADIEAGEFATCLAEGYIRLGIAPAGTPTVDFEGGVFNGVHKNLPGEIAHEIARVYGDFSIAELDGPTFDILDRLVPYPVERWFGPSDNVTVAGVLTTIVGGVEGWWGDNARGLLQVGRIFIPRPGDPFQKSFFDRDTFSGQEEQMPRDVRPAVDDVTVLYARNYNVQTSDLDTDITPERRALIQRQWRAINKSATVAQHLESRPLEVETPYSTEAGADAHADDLLTFYGGDRKMIRLEVAQKGFNVDIGNKVRVTNSEVNVTDELFLVIGVSFELERNRTVLTLYN